MIRRINTKDKFSFIVVLNKYIPNLQFVQSIFNQCLKHGQYCLISDNGILDGVLLRYKDTLKYYGESPTVLDKILQVYFWTNDQLLTVNTVDKFLQTYKKYGFRIIKKLENGNYLLQRKSYKEVKNVRHN